MMTVVATPSRTSPVAKRLSVTPPCLNDEKKPGHLHSYGIDKKYQSELFHKVQHIGVHRNAEVPHQDTYKEYECDTQRYTEDFNSTQQDA